MSDYLNWDKHPFTVDGVEFISYINPNGDLAPTVARVPAEMFQLMNISTMRNVIGSLKFLTRHEIEKELKKVNKGYSNAYVGLA